jgi:predicted nucleic acid-binding Zn ribbon protein
MKKKRRRPRLAEPEGLDGILDRAGESRFAKREVPVAPRIWREAVGGRIADRAEPIALVAGVLTIRAATSVWANELSMLSTTLIARLNERKIAVKELRFRVGPIESALRPPERRVSRAVAPPAAIPADLARELVKVEDEELRRDIAQAASRSLAWRAHVTPRPATSEPRAARAPLSAETENDRRGRR